MVLRKLGEGGMGLVLQAYDPKLRREVALKCLKPGSLSEEFRLRLVREAQAMAQLSHPHVVSVHDVELQGDEVVLVMEFVDGLTLDQWLDRWHEERKRSPREVLRLYLQAGQGVAAAHRAGLLHRDFKPGNVLVSAEGIAKVTDFGLARIDDERTLEDSNADVSAPLESWMVGLGVSDTLTQEGMVLGTPRYMAPEQFREQVDLGPSIDQYAFCVSLWQALTGTLPFDVQGTSPKALLLAKEAGPVAWPATSSVPRRWGEALRKGLHPDPEARWPSMDALLEALSYDPTRRRNQALLGGAGLTIVAFGATAWSGWAEARAQRCTGAQEKLTGVWDDTRAQTVERAILGIDRAYAAEVWTQT